ncbi:MAG: Acetyl-CoA:oxalate CoA-transferase [Alphaproteobacteria bacterium MarineAlpha9_Bin2]|nr:MAG: Acetyl-CoA:oxalate CoA-transferase [Alphaproteobacteria bacterium MarineAlpha9_Bin2]
MIDKGPLSGIKVVDLTAMVSGPAATMYLGDQGADVIKIEPLEGELMRKVGTNNNGMTNSFLCCNRSKRSLTLNLKNEQGIKILKDLIKDADVFIQNFRPGVAKRMGLGEKELRKISPQLIYVSISGFGEEGPYSKQRVYDPVIQALSGLADIQRDKETKVPKMIRTVIPDKTTALAAAQAISSALFYKERHGKGQHIKLAMLDVMIAYLWPEGSAALSFVGKETDPTAGQFGLDLVYKTKDDKYITAGAVTDKEWLGICTAMKRKDLLTDKRFDTARQRMLNKAERREIIALEILKHKAGSILKKFHINEVPAAPILSRTELLENEQVKKNKMIEIHESTIFGKVRAPRPAAIYSVSSTNGKKLAPLLGQNSYEILQEMGMKDEKIKKLIKNKIISTV